jgi:Uma2 family endonuclease
MQSKTTNPVRWTIADLVIFEGDRANRYEIIDGELFVTRTPAWKHQAVCGRIVTQLNNWSEQSDLAKTKRSPTSDPFAQRLRFGVGQCGMNFWAMTN